MNLLRLNKLWCNFAEKTSLGLIDGSGAWDRTRDTEFKILNEIATNLKDNINSTGKIKLYTDLDCCPSCRNVINQFKKKYPKIDIEIIYKTKGGGE